MISRNNKLPISLLLLFPFFQQLQGPQNCTYSTKDLAVTEMKKRKNSVLIQSLHF